MPLRDGDRSRSHDAVIRVYDAAGGVIETHEHKGDFKEFNGQRLRHNPATKGDNMRRSKVNAWYGWFPDGPDYRDKLYSAIAAPPKKLPSKVDLREDCSRVEDQGQLGSCTANALVGNLEFLRKKAGRRVTKSEPAIYLLQRTRDGRHDQRRHGRHDSRRSQIARQPWRVH